MARFIIGICLLFLLGACVGPVPTSVVVASYSADGASYVVTGKSASDHAISGVADEDCAMWRLLKLERPCRPYVEEAPTQLADGARAGPAPGWGDPGPAAVAPPAAAAGRAGRLVLGSFSDRARARCLAGLHSGLSPAVIVAELGGVTYYRVASSPRPWPEAEQLRRRFRAAGLRDAWVMDACPGAGCPAAGRESEADLGAARCPAL